MSKYLAYNYVTRRTERVTDAEFNSGPYRPLHGGQVPAAREVLLVAQDGRRFRILAEELPEDYNEALPHLPVTVYTND